MSQLNLTEREMEIVLDKALYNGCQSYCEGYSVSGKTADLIKAIMDSLHNVGVKFKDSKGGS